MGVRHDDKADVLVLAEARAGPRLLLGKRLETGRRPPVILAEHRLHAEHEPVGRVGMQHTEEGERGITAEYGVEHARRRARIGEAVAMDGEGGAPADVEAQLAGVVDRAEVALPEVVAPAIVIAAHDGYRNALPEFRQGRRHPEPVTRHDMAIAEPEIEEVTVDEQCIAEGRHLPEKAEECIGHPRRGGAEVRVCDGDYGGSQHAAKIMVSETTHRVNYSEIDQMGVVYHARYLVWLDVARCEHLRLTGLSYRELEERGYRMVVAELSMRYLRGARYDDEVRVRCWVREVASRKVVFGYALNRLDDGELLATATTTMFVLDAGMRSARLPDDVASWLHTSPDPVRIS